MRLSMRMYMMSTLFLTSRATVGVPSRAMPKVALRDSATADVDRFIARVAGLNLMPGTAIAIVRDGKLMYSRGIGLADVDAAVPMTPETPFYIASSTKPFTATAVSQLVARGILDLDAPIRRYLKSVRMQAPLSLDSITLRQLLSHTHGIDNNGPIPFFTSLTGAYKREDLQDLLQFHRPARQGRGFMYTNIGYNLVGMIIDSVVRGGWESALDKEVFKPLGMRHTTTHMSRVDASRMSKPYMATPTGFRRIPYLKTDQTLHPAGGIISTASDMARFLIAQMNNGTIDGKRVWFEEGIAETHRAQTLFERPAGQMRVTGYGLGWYRAMYDGDTVLVHHGDFVGYHTHLSLMPQQMIGIVIFTNELGRQSAFGLRVADVIERYVYDRLRERPGLAERYAGELHQLAEFAKKQRADMVALTERIAALPKALAFPLQAYEGEYTHPSTGRLTVRAIGPGLALDLGLLHATMSVYDGTRNAFNGELLPGENNLLQFIMGGVRASGVVFQGDTLRRIER